MPTSEEVAFNIRARDHASRVMDRVGGKLGMLHRQGLAVGAGFAAITMGIGLLHRGLSSLQQWLGDSVNKFREFERSMSEVETMLNQFDEQLLPGMTQAVEQMSITFGKSAIDLSRGLYQVLSAGIDASKAVDVLRESAKLATATLTSVETAVDAVTTVLNAYSMSANQASYVTNIMAKTIQIGKLRMDELAGALGYIVPIAAAAGVSFEEISASLATLTKVGQDVHMAARGLRQILNNLISPSTEAQEAMVSLGISFDDLLLEGEGLEGALDKINEATEGNISQISELIPNVRALTAVLGLLTDSGNVMSSSLERIESDFQALNEMFSDISETTDFARRRFEMIGEEIDREMGEHLEASERDVFHFFNVMKLIGKNLPKILITGDLRIAFDEYDKILEEARQSTEQVLSTETVDEYASHFERVNTEISDMVSLYNRMTQRVGIYQAQLEQLYEQRQIVEQVHDYKEALHYIPLALEDASYTTKIFDASTQALVDSIRIQREEIERLNQVSQQYSIGTLKNQISIAKIQLAADRRRGRMTRTEKEQLERLQQANQKYQIQQMENQLRVEQIKQGGLTAEEERLNRIKMFYQEEIRSIENTHARELESLDLTIQTKELLLDEYKDYIGSYDQPGTLLGTIYSAWKTYYRQWNALASNMQLQMLIRGYGPTPNVRFPVVTGGGSKNVTVNANVNVTVSNKDTTENIVQKISQATRQGLISGATTVYD